MSSMYSGRLFDLQNAAAGAAHLEASKKKVLAYVCLLDRCTRFFLFFFFFFF